MPEGLMQNDFGLTVQHLRRRMSAVHPEAEVVTCGPHGSDRSSFATIADRVDRLADALTRIGVASGDRVGTFAWNNRRHVELHLGVPGAGAVLHTIDVSLRADQIRRTISHAGDRVLFVQDSLVPTLAPLVAELSRVERFVIVGEEAEEGLLPRAMRYEDLLAEGRERPSYYPPIDERSAAALCYTSGTTAEPRGVLASHRSLCLHATSLLMADSVGLSATDRVLTLVPMSRVNAWGIPYGAVLAGSDLLLADRGLSPATLAHFVLAERASLVVCTPPLLLDLVAHCDAEGIELGSLRICVCSGSAVPAELSRRLEARGIEVRQAWGATETSAISTVCQPPGRGREAAERVRAKQGQPLPWVELRVVTEDGNLAPSDGETNGELQVRGPWIAAGYFNSAERGVERLIGGWLPTGDVGSVDELGYLEIFDRAEDVIRAGGELISSTVLEDHLLSHPEIVEAAVIARPDPGLGERPLACVVLAEGAAAGAVELLAHLEAQLPLSWLPDRFAFIDKLPKTSAGNPDKKALRTRLERAGLDSRAG
jgi:fatty-acyl-CoA synthase